MNDITLGEFLLAGCVICFIFALLGLVVGMVVDGKESPDDRS